MKIYILLILATFCFAQYTISQVFSGTIEIMPVGNSITYDDFSGDIRPAGLRTGYRQPLWLKLNEAGFNFDFVGGRTAGQNAVPVFDPHNEAWPGIRDDQVADSIYIWLTRKPADVILLHIGTNGLDTASADVRDILNEIDRYEGDFGRDVWVLLARIINRSPNSTTTTTFNNNVRNMALQRINILNDKIILVDMENGAGIIYNTVSGDMRDQLHPNTNGYEKMARIWFEQLCLLLPVNGTTLPPAPTNLVITNTTYNSVNISWNDNSYGESGFIIEISNDSLTWNLLDTVFTNINSYTSTGLLPATKYDFRVRNYSKLGNSTYTNIASVTTPNDPSFFELTAYWPLDNSIADLSGNNHNLTLFNGAFFSTDRQIGTHSLSFDGLDDYGATNVINLGNEFSILLWAKVNTSSNIKTLIANGPSGANSNGFKLMVNTYGTTDRKIILETGTGTTTAHTTSASGTFNFNVWNHVALVVNRLTGAATIYYNGNNVTTSTGVHTGFNNNNVVRLGRMTNNSSTLNGKLDDVRIYNKALTQSEIQAVINGEPLPPSAPSNLNIEGVTETSIQLSWTDNSLSEDGFKIERSSDSLTGYIQIASVSANTTSYTNNSLSPGTKYYYRVRSFNSDGNSAYSNITSATTQVSIPLELTAYWPLDNSTTDVSGNNHNLTLFNGAAFSTNHYAGSHSLSFDGTNDYASSDIINLGNEFSILLWARLNSSSNIRTLVANAASGALSNGFKLMINTYATSDRKIIFETGNGTTAAHTTSASGTFNFNVWNHVALTVNRTTGLATLYYNGNNVTASSGIHTSFNNNAVIRLGRMTNNNFTLNGLLDDVKIFSKVLTLGEIQSEFETFKTTFLTPISEGIYPNPFKDVIYIREDDYTQLQLIDFSGRVRLILNYGEAEVLFTKELEPGIYLLKIIKNNGEAEIRKVVKTNY